MRANPTNIAMTMLRPMPSATLYTTSYSGSSSPLRGNKRHTSVYPGKKNTIASPANTWRRLIPMLRASRRRTGLNDFLDRTG